VEYGMRNTDLRHTSFGCIPRAAIDYAFIIMTLKGTETVHYLSDSLSTGTVR